jgi:hypothetical protein
MIFLYLAVLISAMYWVIKTLAPEMAKPPLIKAVFKAPLRDDTESQEQQGRITKLETMLSEKNKCISLLQAELKSFYVQVRDFDKIKMLLEEEVHRLREQNRIFRSELGLPTALPKVNSIT